MDVSPLLDSKTIGHHPVDSGPSCDIYRGRLCGGRVVALKIGRIRHGVNEGENSDMEEKMQSMLEIWAECTHPNVVQLIGGAILQRGIAVVYGWLEYGSVTEYLKRYPATDRYRLSTQICEGAAYLHANGIIHNNLKGTNVLVSNDGVPQIHLSLLTSTDMADDGSHGKVPNLNARWAAPEILLAESEGTFASDVYALGMETVTMGAPYAGHRDSQVVMKIMNRTPPSRPNDTIPGTYAGNALWELLCTCWSFNPADRPSAAHIRDAMHTVCGTSSALALRLVVTENTRIQDLVAYFGSRGLRNYTELLTSSRIATAAPFADTALANVYKTSLPNQTYIAVKCVKHVTLHKKLKRAARELDCWSSHKHENILPVLGFAVVRGDLGMVSPWMSNGCVTDYVVANPACDRISLCTGLTRAIAYLHDHNVVHGDIKGPNVLVSESGVVRITDFGVSIMDHKEAEFSATSTSRGTQRWQAPEILLGQSDSTKEGDVYALGMTLTEIYTGQPPYGPITWSGQMMINVINGQLRPSRPIKLPLDNSGNELWELMNHCWAGSAGARPTSGEVDEQLKEISESG